MIITALSNSNFLAASLSARRALCALSTTTEALKTEIINQQ